MSRIIEEAEKTKLTENDIPIPMIDVDVTSFLANAAVEACSKLDIKAIITDVYTGRTARNLAAYRGTKPVYAMCYHERLTRVLALSYGIFPNYQKETSSSQEYLIQALKDLLDKKLLNEEDNICYLSGSLGEGHGTTFLEINQIKKIFEAGNNYSLLNFFK